jgi:medium-chain acyl-[acyl-carrier-protein] hydrolase
MAPNIEAVYVHFPARESRFREPAVKSIAGLATGVADAMAPWLDRPFAMFGHSLGGVIAFEVIRALRARKMVKPLTLFVSASRAPHLPYPHAELHRLGDEELMNGVNERYDGSVPAPVLESADLRELFVPALRADLTALETYMYHHEPPLDCPISAFAGGLDRTVPPAAVEAWSIHTNGSFRMRIVEGGHLFLQTARSTLVEAITSDLTGGGLLQPDADRRLNV